MQVRNTLLQEGCRVWDEGAKMLVVSRVCAFTSSHSEVNKALGVQSWHPKSTNAPNCISTKVDRDQRRARCIRSDDHARSGKKTAGQLTFKVVHSMGLTTHLERPLE